MTIKEEHKKKFRRIVDDLNKLMLEIREYEPESRYYLACNTLNLCNGETHVGVWAHPNYEVIEDSVILEHADGGDW